MDKLELARDEALKCLRSVCLGEDVVDMERLRRLLRKQLREAIASLESDPHHAVAFRCIGDALYSQSEHHVSVSMQKKTFMVEVFSINLRYKYLK